MWGMVGCGEWWDVGNGEWWDVGVVGFAHPDNEEYRNKKVICKLPHNEVLNPSPSLPSLPQSAQSPSLSIVYPNLLNHLPFL